MENENTTNAVNTSNEQEVVDFSTDILNDLVARGMAGEELDRELARIKERIPQALEAMVKEALKQPIHAGRLDEYLDSLK